MQPARDEDLLMRQVRTRWCAARVPVEGSKGEWGCGQHEVNFVTPTTRLADMHILFKQGMKEIAAQQEVSHVHGQPWAAEVGSVVIIHISLWRGGKNLFWDASKRGPGSNSRGAARSFSGSFGGLMNIRLNSATALRRPSFLQTLSIRQLGGPTKMAWSHDNRTVGFRVVGHADSFRIENRMPGVMPTRIWLMRNARGGNGGDRRAIWTAVRLMRNAYTEWRVARAALDRCAKLRIYSKQ